MRFHEPIDSVPIRIVEDDHICENLAAFCLWTQLDYDECLASLRAQNGNHSIQLGAWHVEPYFPDRTSRKKPIRVINKSDGEVNEFASIFDASCKLDIPEPYLRAAMRGEGPWSENITVERMQKSVQK